jgi:hypothetical protein
LFELWQHKPRKQEIVVDHARSMAGGELNDERCCGSSRRRRVLDEVAVLGLAMVDTEIPAIVTSKLTRTYRRANAFATILLIETTSCGVAAAKAAIGTRLRERFPDLRKSTSVWRDE